MKLLFILTIAIDINSSEILSDTVDWSDIANIFSRLIPFAIFSISISLWGIISRYFMVSRIPTTESSQTDKIEHQASRNSTFQTQIKQVNLKK